MRLMRPRIGLCALTTLSIITMASMIVFLIRLPSVAEIPHEILSPQSITVETLPPIVTEPPRRGPKPNFNPIISPRSECPTYTNRNYTTDPIIIFDYTHGWAPVEMGECPVRCISTLDSSFFDTADGVILDILGPPNQRMTMQSKSNRKCPSQTSILSSMESEKNYPFLQTIRESTNSPWDWLSTFRLDSDIPMIYFSYAEYNIFAPTKPKTKRPYIASFISNCEAKKRLWFIESLMQYVPVTNYGKCLNNARDAKKGDVVPHTKFSLVFENSEEWDYTTEKLYQALSLGSVPVVLGAPNIASLVPDPQSYIDAKDFTDPEALAKYLIYLDENESEYNKYLKWKTRGFDKRFEKVADYSLIHSRCRLCMKLANMDYREYIPYYKKRWINETTNPFVQASNKDWKKEYKINAEKEKYAPGKKKWYNELSELEALLYSAGTPHHEDYVQFSMSMNRTVFDEIFGELPEQEPFHERCDRNSGRIIRNIREFEYLYTVDFPWRWEPTKSLPTVFKLPIKLCSIAKEQQTWALHRVKR